MENHLQDLCCIQEEEDGVESKATASTSYAAGACPDCLTVKVQFTIALAAAKVVACLWFVSVIGSFFSFFTLAYIGSVLCITLPALYSKFKQLWISIAERFTGNFQGIIKSWMRMFLTDSPEIHPKTKTLNPDPDDADYK